MGIRELAAHYGTSVKTVSRALEQLEQDGMIRVTQGQGIFVEERRFWRDGGTSAGELGLILNDMTIPFNIRLSNILERRAADRGYRLIIRSSGYDPERQESLVKDFTTSDARGIIIVPSPGSSIQFDSSLLYVGEFAPSPLFAGHYAVVDTYSGFYNAAMFLADGGHEAIGYIGATEDIETEPGYRAIQDVLSARHRACMEAFFVSAGGYDADCGFRAMNEIFLNEQYPTAVICFSDTLAAGAMKACRQAGIRVPGHINLIGSGNLDFASLLEPPLTTLKTPAELLGLLTINVLDDLINGRLPANEKISIRLDMELILRDSTTPLGDGGTQEIWL